jgi:hypothetical protein
VLEATNEDINDTVSRNDTFNTFWPPSSRLVCFSVKPLSSASAEKQEQLHDSDAFSLTRLSHTARGFPAVGGVSSETGRCSMGF